MSLHCSRTCEQSVGGRPNPNSEACVHCLAAQATVEGESPQQLPQQEAVPFSALAALPEIRIRGASPIHGRRVQV